MTGLSGGPVIEVVDWRILEVVVLKGTKKTGWCSIARMTSTVPLSGIRGEAMCEGVHYIAGVGVRLRLNTPES